jgi:beta-xylosidase
VTARIATRSCTPTIRIAPLLIKQVKGWIDPCPFWDDDGHAYLVNALSASRSALKSTLIISRMSPDGTRLLDEGTLVYDGHGRDPTVEGPKFYKRNGYYYIFAPAGGVPRGWQLALRSRKIYGPYERASCIGAGQHGRQRAASGRVGGYTRW